MAIDEDSVTHTNSRIGIVSILDVDSEHVEGSDLLGNLAANPGPAALTAVEEQEETDEEDMLLDTSPPTNLSQADGAVFKFSLPSPYWGDQMTYRYTMLLFV